MKQISGDGQKGFSIQLMYDMDFMTSTADRSQGILFITYFDNQNWPSTKPVYIKLKQVIEKELKLKLAFLQIGTECYHENERYFYKRENMLEFLL